MITTFSTIHATDKPGTSGICDYWNECWWMIDLDGMDWLAISKHYNYLHFQEGWPEGVVPTKTGTILTLTQE